MTATDLVRAGQDTRDGKYGVFAIGHFQLALPLEELREVIPRPVTFEPLAAGAAGLIGAVNLRHQVVPVLDLRPAMGIAGDDAPMDIIVVVIHEDHIFGLLAGDVRGVVDRAARAVPTDSAGLTTDVFERPEDGSVVSLLNSAAVRRLPGLPAVRVIEPRTGDDLDENTGAAAPRRTIILLNTAAIGLCIDVNRVHSVIPELRVRPSPMTGGAVLGVVTIGDYEVPVLDPLMHLGLGDLNTARADRGVALSFDEGLLVFAVTEVEQIVAVPDNEILPLPPFAVSVPDALTGIVTGHGDRLYLILDEEKLRRDPGLRALAALGIATGTEQDIGTANAEAAFTPRTFLTYNAGVDVATLLDQIDEILPYPEHIVPLAGPFPGVRGVFTHRGRVIPLVCLTTMVGHVPPADGPPARVLVVLTPSGCVGFVVPHLQAIEQTVWEEEPGQRTTRPEAPLSSSPLVEVTEGGRRRTLPHIDLLGLAAAL
ncbi:chemotaxis protein CheW [Paractinoplanes maris]|uniref:chemotaxis protein CheW n=1 Tax=Paractinoplanes maris TaxID=1734446 RepID=UPI002021087D|nr:chemotaxis protein CheW [Actinoplanes maris]